MLVGQHLLEPGVDLRLREKGLVHAVRHHVRAREALREEARRLAAASEDPLMLGWADLVTGYLADDADEGRRSLERAAETAGRVGDTDLANMALADLGLWHVTSGDLRRGLAMLDEALAATLSAPRGMLEVVVWSSCDMLAACSLVDDIQRATDWCRAADRFMETYGCPFLLARCRAHYGHVLMATGHSVRIPTSVLDSVRTLTATIAAELGESPVGSDHYQALFIIGILLFSITFVVNLSADLIVRGIRGKA